MKTIEISLSVTQEMFLRSSIRREIFRKYVVLDVHRSAGIDVTSTYDDIFELKTLYRQITGEPFNV